MKYNIEEFSNALLLQTFIAPLLLAKESMEEQGFEPWTSRMHSAQPLSYTPSDVGFP